MLLTGAADKLGLNPLNCGREVITVVAIFQCQWKFDLTRNVCNSFLSLSLSLSWYSYNFTISLLQKYYKLANKKCCTTATWAFCGFRMIRLWIHLDTCCWRGRIPLGLSNWIRFLGAYRKAEISQKDLLGNADAFGNGPY